MRIAHLCLCGALASGWSNPAVAADVQTISRGERVDIEAHLAPGKLTLFDFYADWCGPCRALAPTLDRLAAQHPDRFALRKIDITRSGSPAGAQYGVSTIPHLILYDGSGALIREGNPGPVLREVERRLGGGGAGRGGGSGGVPLIPILLALALGIGVAVVLRSNRPSSSLQRPGDTGAELRTTAAQTGQPGWFAMVQNSLEGPFSLEDLERMLAARVLSGDSRVRRRGDAQWKRLDEIVG